MNSDLKSVYGYGSGYGDGYGDGYGCGYGGGGHGGNGYGNGEVLGVIAEHEIAILKPWNYVRIGCKCHSVQWWRDNWRMIAEVEKIEITDLEAEELLCRVSSYVAAQTDGALCSANANQIQ